MRVTRPPISTSVSYLPSLFSLSSLIHLSSLIFLLPTLFWVRATFFLYRPFSSLFSLFSIIFRFSLSFSRLRICPSPRSNGKVLDHLLRVGIHISCLKVESFLCGSIRDPVEGHDLSFLGPRNGERWRWAHSYEFLGVFGILRLWFIGNLTKLEPSWISFLL